MALNVNRLSSKKVSSIKRNLQDKSPSKYGGAQTPKYSLNDLKPDSTPWNMMHKRFISSSWRHWLHASTFQQNILLIFLDCIISNLGQINLRTPAKEKLIGSTKYNVLFSYHHDKQTSNFESCYRITQQACILWSHHLQDDTLRYRL